MARSFDERSVSVVDAFTTTLLQGAVLSSLQPPTDLAYETALASTLQRDRRRLPRRALTEDATASALKASHFRAVDSTSRASLDTLPGLGSSYLSSVLYILELFGTRR